MIIPWITRRQIAAEVSIMFALADGFRRSADIAYMTKLSPWRAYGALRRLVMAKHVTMAESVDGRVRMYGLSAAGMKYMGLCPTCEGVGYTMEKGPSTGAIIHTPCTECPAGEAEAQRLP